MFLEYNLYYKIPKALKKHYDYKSYAFYFKGTET